MLDASYSWNAYQLTFPSASSRSGVWSLVQYARERCSKFQDGIFIREETEMLREPRISSSFKFSAFAVRARRTLSEWPTECASPWTGITSSSRKGKPPVAVAWLAVSVIFAKRSILRFGQEACSLSIEMGEAEVASIFERSKNIKLEQLS